MVNLYEQEQQRPSRLVGSARLPLAAPGVAGDVWVKISGCPGELLLRGECSAAAEKPTNALAPREVRGVAGALRGALTVALGSLEDWRPGPWAVRLLGRRTALALDYRLIVAVVVGDRSFASEAVAVTAATPGVTAAAGTARHEGGAALGASASFVGLPAAAAQLGRQRCRVQLHDGEELNAVTVVVYAERRRQTESEPPASGSASSRNPALDDLGPVPLARAFFKVASVLKEGGPPRCLRLTLYDDHPGLRRPSLAPDMTARGSNSASVQRTPPALLVAASRAAALAESGRDSLVRNLSSGSESTAVPHVAPLSAIASSDGSGFIVPPGHLSAARPGDARLLDALSESMAAELVTDATAAATSSPVGTIVFSAQWTPSIE